MFTLVEAISLAGDRAKQNDDTAGFTAGRAWVIDGATDLHDKPLTGWASDVAWVAHCANRELFNAAASPLRDAIRAASQGAREEFLRLAGAMPDERWKRPIASMLMAQESSDGIEGVDLGDCRIFALGADGAAFVAGAHEDAADDESALAAQQTDKDKPLLQRANTIEMLRRMRDTQNGGGGVWTFSLDAACAQHARAWAFVLKRPAHILLMTDGLSALTDRYDAYTPSALVQAALDKGLQELGRELRAIENADSGGASHPRFKKSDDATGLLIRLT
ncbi:hypothetical protein U91I_02358 [alpha proteobacterium U9-1i]|nr:hypothetical protein U91I_02358 [alpha proteobacterium U9-1i]